MSTTPKTKINESEIMISIDSMHKWFGDFHVLKNIISKYCEAKRLSFAVPRVPENLL